MRVYSNHEGLIIKMDLKEIGLAGRNSIRVSQDRDQWRTLVNMLMNLVAE
jgi:hypothetical protein